MCVIYTVETHDQVLSLWRAQQVFSLHVLHLDFHCDMRGLLVDHKAQRAYRIWDISPAVDKGNFSTHAILEGRVRGLRWVHGEPGGRQYDESTYRLLYSAWPAASTTVLAWGLGSEAFINDAYVYDTTSSPVYNVPKAVRIAGALKARPTRGRPDECKEH